MRADFAVYFTLTEDEQFTTSDNYDRGGKTKTIHVTRLHKSLLTSTEFFAHGPLLKQGGEMNTTDPDGCVIVQPDSVPAPLLEKIQAALAPHLAVRQSAGAEAARQAALG